MPTHKNDYILAGRIEEYLDGEGFRDVRWVGLDEEHVAHIRQLILDHDKAERDRRYQERKRKNANT